MKLADKLNMFTIVTTLIVIIISIASYVISSKKLKLLRDKQETDLFHKYSVRYTQIVSDFLSYSQTFNIKFSNRKNIQHRQSRLNRKFSIEFWYLIAEERNLYKQDLISQKNWDLWEKSLKKKLELQFFVDSFEWFKETTGLSNSLKDYIEGLLDKNNAKLLDRHDDAA